MNGMAWRSQSSWFLLHFLQVLLQRLEWQFAVLALTNRNRLREGQRGLHSL